MLQWLRTQPTFAQVLWLWLMLECLKIIAGGDMLPAFWRGLTGT